MHEPPRGTRRLSAAPPRGRSLSPRPAPPARRAPNAGTRLGNPRVGASRASRARPALGPHSRMRARMPQQLPRPPAHSPSPVQPSYVAVARGGAQRRTPPLGSRVAGGTPERRGGGELDRTLSACPFTQVPEDGEQHRRAQRWGGAGAPPVPRWRGASRAAKSRAAVRVERHSDSDGPSGGAPRNATGLRDSDNPGLDLGDSDSLIGLVQVSMRRNACAAFGAAARDGACSQARACPARRVDGPKDSDDSGSVQRHPAPARRLHEPTPSAHVSAGSHGPTANARRGHARPESDVRQLWQRF